MKNFNRLAQTMVCAAALFVSGCATDMAGPEKRSAPSDYAGYSTARFDGYQRTSFYVPVRDGTRLAVDLFRPTQAGKLTDEKFPVVWMHTPYNRRDFRGKPAAEAYPGYALRLVEHGYNVALVDFRGLYASFGTNIGFNRGEWVDAARWDAYDITEYFAAQSYSNGKIGMWGCSATGGSQMQALTTNPPSLKAVIPMSAELDAYPFAVMGGIARTMQMAPPGTVPGKDMVALRDAQSVAVDGEDGAVLLAEAKAIHAGNTDSIGMAPDRDSLSSETGLPWWSVSSPHTYLDAMKNGKVGVFSVANWDEASTRHGPFFTFNNLSKENTKLLVGPATHCDWSTVKTETGFDLVTEELRFYDYWLKGIENHVMSEPAVTYFTYNAPAGDSWRTSEVWPLSQEIRTSYYLHADGTLSKSPQTDTSRMDGTLQSPPKTETVTVNPVEGGLIFETEVLSEDTEVTGHPVATFWLQSQVPDADITAFLYDVAPDGTTRTYQMFGRLRASHRKVAEAPYNALGMPWHSFLSSDAASLPQGEAVEVSFEMLPMSYNFPSGHKIRLQIVAASPDGTPGGKLDFLAGGATPSRLILPIIPR